MNNSILLFIALLVAIMIVVIIQVVLHKKSQKQKQEYPELWQHFELSKKRNDLDDILKIGNKLFFHKFLPTEHLKIIRDTAEELEGQLPEFKNLRLNADKKLLQRENEESYRN